MNMNGVAALLLFSLPNNINSIIGRLEMATTLSGTWRVMLPRNSWQLETPTRGTATMPAVPFI